MGLLTHLNNMPILRPVGIPPFVSHACVITVLDQLHSLRELLASFPHINLQYVVVLDLEDTIPDIHVSHNGEDRRVMVGGVAMLPRLPHLEKIYISPPYDSAYTILTQLGHYVAAQGPQIMYIHPLHPPESFGSQYIPDFFENFSSDLEDVYSWLADDYSREVYAARVKALLTGNSGYLPISPRPEYFHPLVRPEAGDVMIDGGVSDMVAVQEKFACAVGTSGKIYGFEPMPSMCTAAAAALSKYPQYELHCMGLGHQCGTAFFEDRRDSSRMTENSREGTVVCDITTIDSFMEEKQLARLDCIKLDIEGAELAALRGAKKTIQNHRPKLIICLYHKASDLISIPAYIKSIASEYELYVAHSSCHFTDTILYARIPGAV